MDSLLYTTDGGRRKVTPSNGTDFSLEELQGFVGGYIEIIRLGDNRLIIVNEEGKILGLPKNTFVTKIIQSAGRQDIIVGNVLICNLDKVK